MSPPGWPGIIKVGPAGIGGRKAPLRLQRPGCIPGDDLPDPAGRGGRIRPGDAGREYVKFRLFILTEPEEECLRGSRGRPGHVEPLHAPLRDGFGREGRRRVRERRCVPPGRGRRNEQDDGTGDETVAPITEDVASRKTRERRAVVDPAADAIFVGDLITGPDRVTQTFTAPAEPGTYYFQCDVHPFMNGAFIVEQA